MNILNIFKKKPEITYILCKCGNLIDEQLYRKTIKRHKIGIVFKDGRNFDLYCDGKERK